ncbi:MAG: hypothetical protein AAF385_07055 [Pseudomonadota bacterium]
MAKSKKYKDLASPLMLMSLLSIGLISSLSGQTRVDDTAHMAQSPTVLHTYEIDASNPQPDTIVEVVLDINQLAEDIALGVSHRVLSDFIGQPELRLSF